MIKNQCDAETVMIISSAAPGSRVVISTGSTELLEPGGQQTEHRPQELDIY